MHVSLTQQVQQVEDTYELLALALGEAATADLFRRSVFFQGTTSARGSYLASSVPSSSF
jgi:hypothetical protein